MIMSVTKVFSTPGLQVLVLVVHCLPPDKLFILNPVHHTVRHCYGLITIVYRQPIGLLYSNNLFKNHKY